jgi:hypothetical protein
MRLAHILEGDCTIEAVDVHVERHGSSFGRTCENDVGARDLLIMELIPHVGPGDYLDLLAT